MKDLKDQLTYTATVLNPGASSCTLVIGGMGGSALAGEAVQFLETGHTIVIHRDYGIPDFVIPDALYVAISYSGNTEETLDFAETVVAMQHPLAVITSGGKLRDFAAERKLPLVLVPPGHAPRNALMYMVRALLTLLKEEKPLADIAAVSLPESLTEEAEQDAHFLLQSVPLFYASNRNVFLARLAKLVLNESARTPSFMHTFPELNHNEMQAFDTDMPEGLEHLFRFFLFADATDDVRLERRREVFTRLMKERGRLVHTLPIGGASREETLALVWIRMILIGRYLAETRGIDPNTAPLIEAFKKAL